MAYRDQRHDQHDERREPQRRQMGQYAEPQRQHDGERHQDWHDARNGDARHQGSDLGGHDPAQVSYGRAGAPEVHGAPSGGYRRGWQADPGYNQPGYMRNRYGQGDGSRDERRGGHEQPGYRNQAYREDGPGNDEGRHWQRAQGSDDDHRSQERFQGGAGGYRSNAGPYAGSQTYGGYGDQLGYGSEQGGRQQRHHHDPEYQQWREQQMRSLDDDYQSWRGERYKKFSEEFDTWRKNRQGAGQTNDLPGSAGNPADKSTGGSGSSQ